MRKKKLVLCLSLATILLCGCNNNNSKIDISQFDNEKDAIISTFGEYNSQKGSGVVLIDEKKDEKDRTYIYYIAKAPSLEGYKRALQSRDSTKKQKKVVNNLYEQVEQEAGDEIIKKIDKLYSNKNVNRIRIEVGVVWPYNKNSYSKPGENIVGKNIVYIKTFNFTRDDYTEVLKEYTYNKQAVGENSFIKV